MSKSSLCVPSFSPSNREVRLSRLTRLQRADIITRAGLAVGPAVPHRHDSREEIAAPLAIRIGSCHLAYRRYRGSGLHQEEK